MTSVCPLLFQSLPSPTESSTVSGTGCPLDSYLNQETPDSINQSRETPSRGERLYPAIYPEILLDSFMFFWLPVGFASGETLESFSRTSLSLSQSPKDWMPDFSTTKKKTYFDTLFELAPMFPESLPRGTRLVAICGSVQ